MDKLTKNSLREALDNLSFTTNHKMDYLSEELIEDEKYLVHEDEVKYKIKSKAMNTSINLAKQGENGRYKVYVELEITEDST